MFTFNISEKFPTDIQVKFQQTCVCFWKTFLRCLMKVFQKHADTDMFLKNFPEILPRKSTIFINSRLTPQKNIHILSDFEFSDPICIFSDYPYSFSKVHGGCGFRTEVYCLLRSDVVSRPRWLIYMSKWEGIDLNNI